MSTSGIELLTVVTASQLPLIALAGLAYNEQRFAPLPVLPRVLIPGALLSAALALVLLANSPPLAVLLLLSAALALFAGVSGRGLSVVFCFALLIPLLTLTFLLLGAGG